MKKTIRVTGCIIRQGEKILMLHRSSVETDPSLWGIPAGKVETKESDIQTVVREVQEETGIVLEHEDVDCLGEISIDYEAVVVNFPIFLAKFDFIPEVILDSHEHVGYKWMTPKDVLSMRGLMKDVDVIVEKFCIGKLHMSK